MVESIFRSHGQEFTRENIVRQNTRFTTGEKTPQPPESTPPPEKTPKTIQEQLQELYQQDQERCGRQTDTTLLELRKIIESRKKET